MKTSTLFMGLLACGSAAAAQQKPNVVVILADDLGWGDVGYHGSVIPTPNIDRLAKQGIELDRYYSAPVSSPARAGVLTGRYPSRFGIRETVLPPWRVEYGLDLNEKTMADVLGENGYKNRAMIGKWHLGHGSKAYYPLNRGFTYFYGCLNGALDYFTHEREGELDWHRNWDSAYDKGYTTDLIAKEASECIEKYSKEGPFFVYAAFNAPHTPFQAPQEEIDKFISREKFAELGQKGKDGYTYRAMVSRMDAGIGRILETLEKNGLMDNTLILFMSDNGGVAGIPLGSTCLPLRGNKFQEWDGGVRVASVIYHKDFKNGRKLDQVTGFVDILPTVAEMAGVKKAPARPYDGMSMLSVFTGKKKEIVRDFYLGCGAAVNSGYKLILAGKNGAMNLKEDFLADYAVDAYEKSNHIAQNPAEAERLRKFVICYDTITPSVKELPYGHGKNGFVAPREWKVDKD